MEGADTEFETEVITSVKGEVIWRKEDNYYQIKDDCKQ